MIQFSNHPLKKRFHYDGLKETADNSRMILFGLPYDGTASFRKGAAEAPDAIRKITLLSQETFSPYFNRDLEDLAIFDAGDLQFETDDINRIIDETTSFVTAVLESGSIPFMIGGEHLVTLPAVKSVRQKYPDLHLIHLDAHTDFIDVLFGKTLSHGTVIRRIWDFLGDNHIFGFGIRSGSKSDFAAYEKHVLCNRFDLTGVEEIVKRIGDKPVYLTVDLDVFDPSLLPGTGTPEAGGVLFPEFIRFLTAIRPLNIVGMDMVELAPQIDVSGNSTAIAGQVSREMMCALYPKK